MSEEMGLEHLAALLAQNYGHITECRVPRLTIWNRRGEERADDAMGDLDIVGLGPLAPDGRRGLLAIECKGYGSPEDYDGWLKPDGLDHIEDLVWSAIHNTKSVPVERWAIEFRARENKPTDCWIVFPGHFTPGRNNPDNWRESPDDYKLASEMKPAAANAWKFWQENQTAQIEKNLLKQAEVCLSKTYGATVRLFPVHILIEELVLTTAQDMNVRRKRYPSPAAEMIRWMVRAVRNDAMSLEVLEKVLKQTF